MPLFGRKPAVPQMGILIDMELYREEVMSGARPGIPVDGRYWVSLIETDGTTSRLIWEQAATYQEAKQHLKEFERNYGKKPKKASSFHVDDVAAIWYVEPKGRPDAMLAILHPVQLRYAQR